MAAYTHAPQKGEPGHCFCAQVFGPDGKAVLTVESTADPAEATHVAQTCASALSNVARDTLASREHLVQIAKRCAARDPEHHGYTIDAAQPDWMPHEWVLQAMRQVALAQSLVSHGVHLRSGCRDACPDPAECHAAKHCIADDAPWASA